MEQNIIVWEGLTEEEKTKALERPSRQTAAAVSSAVRTVIRDVRENGDEAIRRLTKKYDETETQELRVSRDELKLALRQIDPELKKALETAINNIRRFHDLQRPQGFKAEIQPGIVCERIFRPVEKVGLYVPAGTSPLPSTLLMLAIPAQIAGCQRIVVMSPPSRTGRIDSTILAAAEILGLEEIYVGGGAQAIAAMAYGTETIPQVHKIFGPGNLFVTEAKLQVAFDPGGATIDGPAGPSEVLIIADGDANPAFLAADLLSQAEHDRDSQVLLISSDIQILEAVQNEIRRQLETLPRREIADAALKGSRWILVKDLDTAAEVSNRYGPEHLIIQARDPRKLIPQIQHAGSIFLGPWTPESLGDYASGTNHVLPTNGFVRSMSGVGVDSFVRSMSLQEATAIGLKNLGPVVQVLAACEQLEAHRRAVSVRLAFLEKELWR